MFTKLSSDFWIDYENADLISLGTDAQIMALYLLGNSHHNMLGIYYLPIPYIASDMKLTHRKVKEIIQKLCSINYCTYDEKTQYVWVRNAIAVQFGESIEAKDNRIKSLQTIWNDLPAYVPFLEEFFQTYQKLLGLEMRRILIFTKKNDNEFTQDYFSTLASNIMDDTSIEATAKESLSNLDENSKNLRVDVKAEFLQVSTEAAEAPSKGALSNYAPLAEAAQVTEASNIVQVLSEKTSSNITTHFESHSDHILRSLEAHSKPLRSPSEAPSKALRSNKEVRNKNKEEISKSEEEIKKKEDENQSKELIPCIVESGALASQTLFAGFDPQVGVLNSQGEISPRCKSSHLSNKPELTAQPSEIVSIFEHWKKTMRHPNAILDVKRKTLIYQALKLGYSAEELMRAITGCSLTPHNIGQNDRGQRYDGLHVILRDADQIDRFIQNYHNPPKPYAKSNQRLNSNLQAADSWVRGDYAKV